MTIFNFIKPNISKLERQKNIKGLIKALDFGSDYTIRALSAEALGRIDDALAINPLVNALMDKIPTVRKEAASALDNLKWTPQNTKERISYLIAKKEWSKISEEENSAIEPLLKTLCHSKEADRSDIAKAILKIGDQGVEQILNFSGALDLSNEEDKSIHRWLIGILASLGESIANQLISALKKEDPGWFTATCALGNIKGARITELLIQSLNDDVRHMSVETALSSRVKVLTEADLSVIIGALKSNDKLIRQRTARGCDLLLHALKIIGNNKDFTILNSAIAQALVDKDEKSEELVKHNDLKFSNEEDYIRRCLEVEFYEEKESRTFRSDPSFATVLGPLNEREYLKAIKAGKQILSRFSDFDLLYEWIANAYLSTQQLQNSREVLLDGLVKAKRKCLLLTDMGDTEWQLGNLGNALYYLSQALHCLASNAIDYNAYLLLSYIAKGIGLLDLQELLLSRVDALRGGQARLDPGSAERLLNLVRDKRTDAMKEVLLGIQKKYFLK
jgi:HEAT repeat protein